MLEIEEYKRDSLENLELILRRICIPALETARRKGFDSARHPVLRHISVVGGSWFIDEGNENGYRFCTKEENGSYFSIGDRVRLLHSFKYLLEAGLVIDPGFDLDIINLEYDRSFLMEDTPTDLVLCCFLNDYSYSGSGLAATCGLTWNETAWYDRVKKSDAKVIVNDPGGLSIERFRGIDYESILCNTNHDENDPREDFCEYEYAFQTPYLNQMRPFLNPDSHLASDAVRNAPFNYFHPFPTITC